MKWFTREEFFTSNLSPISLNLGSEDSARRVSDLNIFPINSRVLYFGIFQRKGEYWTQFGILAIFTLFRQNVKVLPQYQQSQYRTRSFQGNFKKLQQVLFMPILYHCTIYQTRAAHIFYIPWLFGYRFISTISKINGAKDIFRFFWNVQNLNSKCPQFCDQTLPFTLSSLQNGNHI